MEDQRHNRAFLALAIGLGGLLILAIIGLVAFLFVTKPVPEALSILGEGLSFGLWILLAIGSLVGLIVAFVKREEILDLLRTNDTARQFSVAAVALLGLMVVFVFIFNLFGASRSPNIMIGFATAAMFFLIAASFVADLRMLIGGLAASIVVGFLLTGLLGFVGQYFQFSFLAALGITAGGLIWYKFGGG